MVKKTKSIFSIALEDYRNNIRLIALFLIPAIIAIFITEIISYPTYTAIGGVFLRTLNIKDMPMWGWVVSIIAVVVSLLLISTFMAGMVLIVKYRKMRAKLNTKLLKEAIVGYSLPVTVLFLIYTAIMFILQIMYYSIQESEKMYSFIMAALFYFGFYIPYSIIIDDLDLISATKKALTEISRNPLSPILWALFGLLSLIIIQIIMTSVMPYYIGKMITLVLNTVFIMPYLIILGAHMYMQKYPLMP